MDSTLPPLPEPRIKIPLGSWVNLVAITGYTAEQVRAYTITYGAECRRQALEECAALCSGQIPPGCSTSMVDVSRNQGIRACNDAIRALSSQGQQQ